MMNQTTAVYRTTRAAPASRIRQGLLALAGVLALALPLSACGGAGGGAGPFGAGQGLVLLNFQQEGFDNAALNTVLEFTFSEPLDPATVSSASIQVRAGPSFGSTVKGLFIVQGSSLFFEPALAGLCDLSDGGFQADTQYRVQVIGFPEEFSVKNTQGQHLGSTETFEFHTRNEQDPDRFTDQVPGAGPVVSSVSPASGSEAVKVEGGNQVVLTLSENVDPCSVTETSVQMHMFQIGDPAAFAPAIGGAGPDSGFVTAGGDTSDQTPLDHTTWGTAADLPNVTTLAEPQRILADIKLEQDFSGTRLVVTPRFGFDSDPARNQSKFPENALLVVRVSFDVQDYGGLPLTPFTMSFTTENLTTQASSYEMENEGETPYLDDESTADINTDRAPSKVQGYILFAGDGDNGTDLLAPSLPETPASGCTLVRQANSGAKDDFDPLADVLLDTGGTPNTCANVTDGSEAVVWEFRSFRIRNGVTVRVVGVNPAIILVQGDAQIEAGGRLLLRGDGTNGAPQGRGGNGYNNVQATNASPAKGGVGVAGGGRGGNGQKPHVDIYGDDGETGVGSPSGYGVEGGTGAGLGGVSTRHIQSSVPWPSGSSQGGGGGGHAMQGIDATAAVGTGISLLGLPKGTGGEAYPTTGSVDRMLKSEAGGGGGAAGYGDESTSSSTFTNGGGAGGAGGGFVDITSSGDIFVFGTIDAAGGRGGGGGSDTFYGAGGGGGGAGGGVRLLTPNNINVSGGTISAAGGAGGTATVGTGAGMTGPLNHGGDGGVGRIVFEDGDSVIAGLSGASVSPSEGSVGFFRGTFDATRFQGGGLQPAAVTDVFAAGPLNPTFVDPVQNFGVQEDFVAGIPTPGAPGIGNTAMLIEVRGYQMLPDGSVDLASETDWFSIGSFKDIGIATLPEWNVGHPGDIAVSSDNALAPGSPHGNSGAGFSSLNGTGLGGFEFIQVRLTMYLPNTVGPFDPGTFLDHWSIRFDHDQ